MNGGSSNRTAPVVTIASVCVGVLALWAAREFLIPLVFCALVSWVLLPLVLELERRGLKRVLAVLLVCAAAYGAMGVVAWVAASQLIEVAETASSSRQQLREKLAKLGLHRWQLLAENLQEASKPAPPSEPTDVAPENLPPPDPEPTPVRVVDNTGTLALMWTLASTVLRPLAVAGFAAIVGVFIMLGWEDVRDRLIRLVSRGRIALTTQALDEMSHGISRVLRAQVALNVSVGAAVAIGLWALGVPSALLWGVLTALFRFIPLVGPIAAATLPALLTLATTDGWTHAAIVLGLFVAVEVIVSNFIEPTVLGSRAGVSTVALLVAAAFWTWIWGFPGLLLATPITVGMAVIGRHVPGLRFLDVLLGERPVLTPAARLYQRVAALDRTESNRLVELAEHEHGVERVIHDLLTPALCASENARTEGEIDTPRAEAMFALLGDLSDGVNARLNAGGATSPPPTDRVLCIPAANEADEVAASLLTALMTGSGVPAQSMTAAELGDLPSLLSNSPDAPCVVCVCGASDYAGRAARIRARQVTLRRHGARVRIVLLDPVRDGMASMNMDVVPRDGQRGEKPTLAEAVEWARSERDAQRDNPSPDCSPSGQNT